jgi:hypothetical protein
MVKISDEYVNSLPQIYKDIFGAFWMFNPTRKQDYEIPVQSLFSVLSEKYTLGEIALACDSMSQRNVLEKTNKDFYHPTSLGEQILLAVTAKPPVEVEPFPEPPTELED